MTRCQGHVLSCAFVLGQCLDLTITFPPCMGQKLAARCIGKAFLLLRPTRALYLLRASTSSHHMVLYRNGGQGRGLYMGDDVLRMLQADSPNRGGRLCVPDTSKTINQSIRLFDTMGVVVLK